MNILRPNFNRNKNDINELIRANTLKQYENLQNKLRETQTITERQDVYNTWLIESRQENQDLRDQYRKDHQMDTEDETKKEYEGETREIEKEKETMRESK